MTTGSWEEFAERARTASAMVPVLPKLTGDAVRLVASVRTTKPLVPMVLVTTKESDNARALGRVLVDEVVWHDQLEISLLPAIHATRSSGQLIRLADSTPELARIAVLVLALAGDEDGLTPVAEARRITDGVPDGRPVVIPGAGHLANLENPAAFNHALATFLA